MYHCPCVELCDVSVNSTESFSLYHINAKFSASALHFLTSSHLDELRLLFAVIDGQISPQSGHVCLQPTGGNVFHLSGYSTPPLFPEFSLAENIYFTNYSKAQGVFGTIDQKRLFLFCQKLLARFSLVWNVQAPLSSFSLAQQQLVLLLRALVSDCYVVLLDEPCALLTDEEQAIAYQIIHAMREEGRCVLIATTKLQEIFEHGDTVTIFDNGKVSAHLALRSELTEENLLALLSGQCYLNRYPRRERPLGKTVFQVEHLSVHNILKDISFTIHEGENLGVTGLAGSGRSLLCRSLFGLEPCHIQNLKIHGRPVTINDSSDAVAHGLAFLPEGVPDDSLFDNLTVGQNLSFASLHRFLHKKIYLDHPFEQYLVDNYLDKLRLPSSDSVFCQELTRGEQQKLSLGRWMMSGASVYILDEPTSGLDVPSKIDIYNMIEDLRRNNCSLLMVSSDMEELLGMCDRILVIAHGRICLDAPTHKLTKKELLYAASAH